MHRFVVNWDSRWSWINCSKCIFWVLEFNNNLISWKIDNHFWLRSFFITTISFTIPENATSIGQDSFRLCVSLSRIVIPKNVKSIGAYAFYNCRKITSFVVPDTVTQIDSGICVASFDLTSAYISNSITEITS